MSATRFDTVLIANRGAIACRIIRTLKKLGMRSVAVYSEADADSAHVGMADVAICIGPAAAAESYLRSDKILAAAKETGAGAIHPGYGFLSENAEFAAECEREGIAFIGPTPEQMIAFGLKHTARELAEKSGVPLLPGSALLDGAEHARKEAARIGYPVMLKSTAGGGGIGMRLLWNEDELAEAYASVDRLARANFKNAGIYLEKYVEHARHVEVQLFGDGKGEVLALGERDCSVQRRNQKVIEETPAPGLSDAQRTSLHDTAVRLGKALNYRNAGTVEFVLDAVSGNFYFLEVNTRLQVEHGVTEQISGVDLVEWMVRLAQDSLPPLASLAPKLAGASIQVRLYAEDPAKNFQPSSGVLTEVSFPEDARIETWVARGNEVPPYYDPMIAKLIVTADTREAAVAKMADALARTRLAGIETNLDYLRAIVAGEVFSAGKQTTRYLNSFAYAPQAIEVLEAGVQTTVQDWPGRTGYWDIGVPPSGPMDPYALRLANKLVGNPQGTAGLECTLTGPRLRFHSDAVIAVCGAPMVLKLDGETIALWQTHDVKAGSVLDIGSVDGGGARTYLAVRGGLDVPDYLGSKSTFTLGQFGGHAGRTLRVGDMLHIADAPTERCTEDPSVLASPAPVRDTINAALIPSFANHWDIGVLYGPHGAPDFFTDEDIDMFFSTAWEVHYNSSRTGVRLIGPKPQWARHDGGEAGLHPSNIHDNAYAIGAVDFTGDMPVILGPDGPSLGGFVCPATIVAAERWKMGQLRPGDTVNFRRLSPAQATALEKAQEHALATLAPLPDPLVIAEQNDTATPAIRHATPATETELGVVYRQAGDKYLLVEYGPLVLDLNLRFRVHALMNTVQAMRDAGALPGIIDLTPGIRSLQIHYDSRRIPCDTLIATLQRAQRDMPAIEDMVVPTRTVWLPLSWDDAATRLAIEKYMQSVRPDAPWCPSNIEFIRRINGLDSIEDVKRIVFDASYLVMGLGDVYLGAPVATPVDPRHRLVTTKYNPARTWTPENAVGIGGAYMCVYGMEGPGGYQFVGRTLQMWNRWRDASNGALEFEPGKPWLLRFFDQIRFYPVSEEELVQIRRDFPAGRYRLKVEEGEFSLRDYNAFLKREAESITAFKTTQQASFDAERERWREAGQAEYVGEADVAIADPDHVELPPGGKLLQTHVPGNVWKIEVTEGQQVAEGDTLMIVESMKMEFPVRASSAGTVYKIFAREGSPVGAGQDVMILATE
ncbi:urea carboxylase [Uliginosibacterium sp. H3]|uniref:Urea carboxylase n=1 Tax=Uliginosibacterium silvisoli TaxID=3114758 RepID=A0ABU6K5X5_9RHOO|nr:urea carboxylase [Uliginosibacterium sp. H3]